MKLSQREKSLLWCFVNIGVLLLGIKWAFSEVNQYYQASVEMSQTNESDALQAERLLSKEKELTSRLQQYKKELNEEESYYFPKVDSEYMEAWIMGISQKYPIEINALTMEEIRMQDEEGVVEVLPIWMTVQAEEQTLFEFLDGLLNDGRYVTLEQLEMETTKAQIKIAVYRTEKESDGLDQTVFNKPLGKEHIMKPVPQATPSSELEAEQTQIPEESSQNLSAIEALITQLVRSNQDEIQSEKTPTSDENVAASMEAESQNREETEEDGNEESTEATTETTQEDKGQTFDQ